MKRVPAAIAAAACLVVLVLYWRNDDMAGQPAAPRGTGQYLPILDRGDGHMLYLMARSTALDFDWNFDNDLGRFGDPWNQSVGPSGHKVIPHPIGPALIWTPLIWLAEAGAVVANVFGADIPLHGYTPWHQRFVFLSSVLCACLAVLFGRRLAMTALGARWSASYAAAAVLLGTSITYYATYCPSYGHALDAGTCALLMWRWATTLGRCDVRRWISLGALLGLAALVRSQNLALGVIVAVEAIAAIAADLRRRAADWRVRALGWIGGGALVLAVALVVFVPQLVYWKVVYGHAFGLPQGPRYTRLGSPMILELLYAPRNGWFSTTPLAYLAVIGLSCLPRRARLLALGLGAAVAMQVYLNSSIYDWWGMNSFGARRLCSMTLPLAVGLAALLWRCGRVVARVPRVPRPVWHVLAAGVLGCFAWWNLWRIDAYKHGVAATAELVPACCDHVPPRLRGVLGWIYERIGDPFEFPANAWFAWKHDVDLRRWDTSVGYYATMPSAQDLLDDAMYNVRGAWRIGAPGSEPYLVGGWSGANGGERVYRWTLDADSRVLVPNLMPYSQRFTLWVAPGLTREVTIRWDGREVVHRQLHAGWQTVTWQIDDLGVGEHDLAVEAYPLPFFGSSTMRPTEVPVGVAVGLLEIDFVPPDR